MAEVAFKEVLSKTQELLPPTQLVVGVKDAVTHIALAVLCAHDSCVANPDSGILQIDVSNAFNTISRRAILDSVWTDFPSIAKCRQMHHPVDKWRAAGGPSRPLLIRTRHPPHHFTSQAEVRLDNAALVP